MALHRKSIGPLVLQLLAVLSLLGCPRVGFAAGTWSVLSLPHKPGEVHSPTSAAVDPAGNLYVADQDIDGNDRIEKRDARGNWSLIATEGTALGQVYNPDALAVDPAGNLYVAEFSAPISRLQKRDARGNWSLIAAAGEALGEVRWPYRLAVDS